MEGKCLRHLGVEQRLQSCAGRKNIENSLTDDATFCTLMKGGINHKQLHLWYATSVVLSDFNTGNQSLPRYQLNQTSSDKRSVRFVIYCSSDDDSIGEEQSYSTFCQYFRGM